MLTTCKPIRGFLAKVKFIYSQLLAMDASARVTMKDAAKCDKRREWQNSANQENAERTLHFQVIPESMSASGRLFYSAVKHANSRRLFG